MTSFPPRTGGTVRWFNEIQGHGRILTDDGREVTVRFNAIAGEGYRSLDEGERIECTIVPGTRGLQAENVVLIDSTSG